MELPFDNYVTSGVMDDDVVIEHHEYFCMYQYECGKTFLEICVDMELDKVDTQISLL